MLIDEGIIMNDYSIKHNKTGHENQRSAGDIQAQVSLRLLAKLHLGQPLFSTSLADTHINPFDPDSNGLHVFDDYYRAPDTGDRGSSIKFIQRLRRCSYDQALAYLEGWLDRQSIMTAPIQNERLEEKTPVQLALFALKQERGR